MKSLLLTLVLVAGLGSQISAAQENFIVQKGVEMKVFGGIAGFDKDGYQALRSMLGFLVAKGMVSQFKTNSMGSEGGGSFCIEAAGKFTSGDILKALSPIHIDQKTIFELTEIKDCQ